MFINWMEPTSDLKNPAFLLRLNGITWYAHALAINSTRIPSFITQSNKFMEKNIQLIRIVTLSCAGPHFIALTRSPEAETHSSPFITIIQKTTSPPRK